MKPSNSPHRVCIYAFSCLFLLAGCGEDPQSTPQPSDTTVCDSFSAVVPNSTHIETREQLEALHASGCSEVQLSLRIFYIPGVTDLRLLENIRRVEAVVEIAYTEDLETLDGLEGLEEYEIVSLIQNDRLVDTSALPTPPLPVRDYEPQVPTLKTIVVHHNDRLEDLSGLGDIERLPYDIDIAGNRSLKRLSAFDALDEYGAGAEPRFIVRDNPSLPQCEVQRLWERLDVPDPDRVELQIEGNDTDAVCP